MPRSVSRALHRERVTRSGVVLPRWLPPRAGHKARWECMCGKHRNYILYCHICDTSRPDLLADSVSPRDH
jgi:hypothetical protein